MACADLEQRLRVLQEPADDGVAGLVERHRAPLDDADDLVLLLQAADDAVHRRLEVDHADRLLGRPSRDQRRLVAHVGDVCSGEACDAVADQASCQTADAMMQCS